jgi:hypothetical protein
MGIRDRPTAPRSPWQNGIVKGRSARSDETVLTCCRVRRATPSPRASLKRELLKSSSNTSVAEQGCAGVTRRRTGRTHSLPSDLGWIASPLCPNLIYDRHRPAFRYRSRYHAFRAKAAKRDRLRHLNAIAAAGADIPTIGRFAHGPRGGFGSIP